MHSGRGCIELAMRIEPETGVKFENVAGIDEAKEVKHGNKCVKHGNKCVKHCKTMAIQIRLWTNI
jgi:hypothetical protein